MPRKPCLRSVGLVSPESSGGPSEWWVRDYGQSDSYDRRAKELSSLTPPAVRAARDRTDLGRWRVGNASLRNKPLPRGGTLPAA